MTTYLIPDFEITRNTQAGLKRIQNRLRGNYFGLTRATDDEVFAIVFGHYLRQFNEHKLQSGTEVAQEIRKRIVRELRTEWSEVGLLTDDVPRRKAKNLLAPSFSHQEDINTYAQERAQQAYELLTALPTSQTEVQEALARSNDQSLIDMYCMFLAREGKPAPAELSESSLGELRIRVDESRVKIGKVRLFPALENTTYLDVNELDDFKRTFELKALKRREIRGQNYSGQKLDHQDFRNVDFIDCVFHDTSCIETKFDGAHFAGTDITISNFDSASLNQVVFGEGARLEGTNFAYAKLRFAKLMSTQAKNADFGWADLYKADLSDAELTEVYFEEANLTDSVFTGAKGTFIHFEKAILDRTDFRKCHFNAPQMSDLDFGNSFLEDGSFGGGMLTGCKFEGTSLRGANFDGALWGSSDFTDVDLSNCIVDNRFMACNLSNTNLSGLDLRGGDFHRTHLDETYCLRSNFAGVYFKETKFNGVLLDSSNLAKAQFDSVEGNAVFSECDLSGAVFTGCELYSPEFKTCNFSDARLNSTSMDNVHFRRGIFHGMTCIESNFDGGHFESLDLTPALFTQCTFEDVRATECVVSELGFVNCEPAGAEFPFEFPTDPISPEYSAETRHSAEEVDESFEVAAPIPVLYSPRTSGYILPGEPAPSKPILDCLADNRDFQIPVSYEDIYTSDVQEFERAFIATLASSISLPGEAAVVLRMPSDQGGVYLSYEHSDDGSITVYMMSNYDLWEPKEEWFRAVMTNLEWFALRLSVPGQIAYRKSWPAGVAPWHVANAVALVAVHVFDVLRDGIPTPLYQWPGDARVAKFAHKYSLAEPLNLFGFDQTSSHISIGMDKGRFPKAIPSETSPGSETIFARDEVNAAYDIAADNDDELGVYTLKYLVQRLEERLKYEQPWMNEISEMITGHPSGFHMIIDDFHASTGGAREVTDIAMVEDRDLFLMAGDGNVAAVIELARRNPDLRF